MGQDEAHPSLFELSCDFSTHRKPPAWFIAQLCAGSERTEPPQQHLFKVGETEYCSPEQLLFGAVSGCHFLGRDGGSEIGLGGRWC